jgi:hypothetical protein
VVGAGEAGAAARDLVESTAVELAGGAAAWARTDAVIQNQYRVMARTATRRALEAAAALARQAPDSATAQDLADRLEMEAAALE